MSDPDRMADARDRYLSLDETEQDSHWGRGQIVFDLLRDSAREAPNPRVAKRLRASIVRDFAGYLGRTRTSVNQHLDVFVAFGIEDIRAQDRAWHWHLVCLRTARRLKLNPRELIETAVRDGLDVPALQALGRVEQVQAELSATCDGCNARVKVTLPKDQVTTARLALLLHCPVCVAGELADGGDPRDAPAIGQLESTAAVAVTEAAA